jgi:acetoacetyl-CoA synthetase
LARLLWEPSEEQINNSNIARYITLINEKNNLNIKDYCELYQWSVNNIEDFWAAIWDFVDIRSSKSFDSVVDDAYKMPGAKWFAGARLNFAENLLRYRDDRCAFRFQGRNPE